MQTADTVRGRSWSILCIWHLCILLFLNQGNVIKPCLLYKENPEPSVWLPQAFSRSAAETILQGMTQVINDPNGTGYGIHREDIALAGKTGTAEIKASVEDTAGTELGWLAVFTSNPDAESPVLVVSMVEDVKERGGSGYVVDKVKGVLAEYFSS